MESLTVGRRGGECGCCLPFTDGHINSGIDSVSTRDIKTFCQEQGDARDDLRPFFEGPSGETDQIEKEGVGSPNHRIRSHSLGPFGAREGREGLRQLGSREHSPCRAGMAFHTDTGPWLANWPRDTSRKKMGNPARASIIR